MLGDEETREQNAHSPEGAGGGREKERAGFPQPTYDPIGLFPDLIVFLWIFASLIGLLPL